MPRAALPSQASPSTALDNRAVPNQAEACHCRPRLTEHCRALENLLLLFPLSHVERPEWSALLWSEITDPDLLSAFG